MALMISKHIELQTNASIKKFIHEYKKITDANLKNATFDKSSVQAMVNAMDKYGISNKNFIFFLNQR